jgi:hypothetical protein
MKKLLVLVMVLGIVASANAALKISVNGEVDVPDTEVALNQSDYVTLDITGDGQNPWAAPYMLIIGPGAINGGVILYPGTKTAYYDAEAKATEGGFATVQEYLDDFMLNQNITGLTDLSAIELMDDTMPPAPLTGKLVDGIIFHCEGPGDVLIRLVGWDEVSGEMYDYDTQVIHQIPEPMTIALLGLGGLFLRRRK